MATNMPPEIISPAGLKVCLSRTSAKNSRLFVLEDITPAYIDAFGLYFDLDPSFFLQHLRNTNWENSIHASDASSLPSTKKSLTYCLWYPELLVFPRQPKSIFKESVEGRDGHFLQNTLEGWKTRRRTIIRQALLCFLLESQKSLDEAESSRLLATLGVLYLPSSLAAGILRMSQDFVAGSKRFWIFVAVEFPLLAVLLVLAGLLRGQHSISVIW
ncbi:hypothetical protein E6O75_ATG05965 [Venturia nashicola]|uniref:Uncharacterized protein n=1 Tax=Venturia nashicola TaxID=86259 RepID=A0A4Z1NV58_9PEZI|nr:hypothetical protein E6O75_ATG05965 [Venturia nashicola]